MKQGERKEKSAAELKKSAILILMGSKYESVLGIECAESVINAKRVVNPKRKGRPMGLKNKINR